jgi:hypothetical protein
MQWLKKYLPVWELGFVLIGLSCISFVLGVANEVRPKNLSEFGLVAFIAFSAAGVGAFWARKWYDFRGQLVNLESKPLIPRKYAIGIPCFVFVVILLSKLFSNYVRSQPEFLEAQTAIKTNPAVVASFGLVKELKMDDWGDEFGWEGGNRSGSCQFKLQGTIRNGIVRISWQDQGSTFVATKIEEVTSEMPEAETTIWSKNEN